MELQQKVFEILEKYYSRTIASSEKDKFILFTTNKLNSEDLNNISEIEGMYKEIEISAFKFTVVVKILF